MIRTTIFTLFASLLMLTQANAAPTAEQPDRNESLYNLEDQVGLKGFDPVSYFEVGGGVATKGLEEISHSYGGVTYFFATQENKDLFIENPLKFEPTYGGWCAWAMSQKGYADINPQLFTINGNRAHFFISRRAKALFDRELDARELDADNFWMAESGEAPRL